MLLDLFKKEAVSPFKFVTDVKVVDMDDVEKILKANCPEDEVCENCKHWSYVSTKDHIGGSYEWGHCHSRISVIEAEEDETYWEDLDKYFQRHSNYYCADFERKQ